MQGQIAGRRLPGLVFGISHKPQCAASDVRTKASNTRFESVTQHNLYLNVLESSLQL